MRAYYSNRLSYKEVEKLVERLTGEYLLSNQKIWQVVSNKALVVSQDLQINVMETVAQATSEVLRVTSKVDIYNSESEEVLLFDDGIQVKSQKAERQSKAIEQTYPTNTPLQKQKVVAEAIGMPSHSIENRCNTFRQRVSRLVRESLSFSKKLSNHIGAIWYFIYGYNAD